MNRSLRNTLILAGVSTTSLLALANLAPLKLYVNGKASGEVLEKDGQLYVPISALKDAGAQVVKDDASLKLRFLPVEGGSMQADSLEGGKNEWLLNGVFRVRVLKVEPIEEAVDRHGFAITLEVGNATKKDLVMAEAGLKSDAFFYDSNGLKLVQGGMDQADYVNGVQYQSMPPSGTFQKTLQYWYPLETKNYGTPGKYILEVDKTFPGFKKYTWTTKTPGMRFFLDR